MKKFFDFLLIVILTVLVINLFSTPEEKQLNNNLVFEFNDKNYNIPASVEINIENNTSSWITFNACDIKIKNSWKIIVFDESFCKDIVVDSWTNYLLDYSSEYNKFEIAWKYNMTFSYNWLEYFDQFELENSWSFTKIFTGLFYAPIYNLMIFLLDTFNWVFGWAIVVITIIIRILLLWPQHKMMLSQKKLQKIQPKIKKVQQEHKLNKQMLGVKLMELYKKEKVNPMGSCGFLLIQMPILLVIYHIILSIKDSSNFFYTYSFLQGFDLNSITFDFFWLDLLSAWGISGLILALIVAGIQFMQIKLSLSNNSKNNSWVVLEKKKGNEWYNQFMPNPEMMNKFMLYWMPSMVAIFTYTLFAWVGLYWWISTLFMLIQQFIVNKIIEK